jgi:hypothetical protein
MPSPRILAIDLRSQLFGYAVLEGPWTLLDFGRKLIPLRSPTPDTVIVRKKITTLLSFFSPSIIVLKHTSGRSDSELVKRKNVMAVIKHGAETQSAKLLLLTRRDIYRAFRQNGNTNKYKIAALTAGLFPELASRLPPMRKNWQPEHHNMAIFDAISVGLAFFAQTDPILDFEYEQLPAQYLN